MATNAGSVSDVTIQKFVDGVLASIKLPNGTYPAAAPNAWKARNGAQINSTDTSEFIVEFRVNPEGGSAWARVTPVGSKAESIEGPVDLAVLATKLV